MRDWEAKRLTYKMMFIASVVIAAICLIMDNWVKIEGILRDVIEAVIPF